MERLALDKKTLTKFGVLMCGALLLITLISLSKHGYWTLYIFIISVFFLLTGFIFPSFLKPIYIFWMRLGSILGYINTRLILFVIFYLIFTPIGLVMRLFGVDLLERGIDRKKESYWKKKDKREFNPLDYERQF